MDKRLLGRTGHKSTLIALGGASARPATLEESNRYIKLALEHGVNHIDVAPTYGSGKAEEILGEWVRDYRKNLFLACKTQKRLGKESSEELGRTLKNLHTDYVDLYQLHGLDSPEELKVALSEDGAVNAILEAKKAGIVKYIGITSHNPLNILKALEAFDFDTVLLPVNYVLHAHRQPVNDYEPVLSLAKKRNLGVIAMKSVAKGPWPAGPRNYDCWYQPFDTQKEVDEALWFALSQDVTTAASSSDTRIATMMIDTAERYSQMDKKEQEKLTLKASKYTPLFPRETIS